MLRTTADKAGMTANCPECGELLEIPAPGRVLGDERRSGWFESPEFAPLPSDARTAGGVPALPEYDIDRDAGDAPAPSRPCPVCGEMIAAAAVLCQFCRSAVGTRRPVANTATNGLAIASMVFGIASIPLVCSWGLGIPLGIAAVTTGLIACRQCSRGAGSGREFAIVGIICGTIPSLLGAALLALFLLWSVRL